MTEQTAIDLRGTFLPVSTPFDATTGDIDVVVPEGDDVVDFTGMTGQARISWQNAADGVNASLAPKTPKPQFVAVLNQQKNRKREERIKANSLKN